MENILVPQLDGEIWKNIDFYNYYVSNFGRIKKRVLLNVSRRVGAKYYTKETILSPIMSNRGYLIVSIYLNKKQKIVQIHRMVAIYFLTPIDGKNIVNHKDMNKINNCSLNLEWTNQSENRTHCVDKKQTESKFTGVYLQRKSNKWLATIYNRSKKKTIYLGIFKTEREASFRYQEAFNEMGYENKYLSKHPI